MMKRVRVSIFLMLSLCVISVYAAQDLPKDIAHGRQTMINNAVTNFSYLTQGFDFLQTQKLLDTTFHDFLEQNVSHDEDGNEDMNFDQVIINAENILVANMKDTFLQTLNTAIINAQNLDEFDDPVFSYVMQHKYDDMRDMVRSWLHEWYEKQYKNGWYRAYCNNDKELVGVFIAGGADINIQDKDGKAPLHHAICFNRKELVSILIAAGADINIKDSTGCSPLHETIICSRREIVKMLIAAGADINIQNKEGLAPLHYAVCYKENAKIVSTLIKKGADVNIQNKNGQTPLHHAAWWNNNNAKIVSILINAGADVNIQDEYGTTAEQRSKDKKIKAILKKAHASQAKSHCVIS